MRFRPSIRLGLIASLAAGAWPAAAQHLPPPSYPSVVELYRNGDPSAALAALDAEASADGASGPVEARILRARLTSLLNRHAEAAALWDEVRQREPALDVLARRQAVDALLRDGRHQAAAETLAPLLQGGDARDHTDLLLGLAGARRLSGETEPALEAYRTVLKLGGTDETVDAARLGLAAVLESAGRLTEAVEVLRETQLVHERVGTYRLAVDAEQRLLDRLDQTRPPFSEAQYEALADRLARRSRFEEAISVLREWQARHPDTGRRLWIEAEIVDKLYRQRANEEAREAAEAFLRRYPASRHAPDIQLLLFRLDVREGLTAEVERRGRAFWTGRVSGATRSHERSAGLLLAAYLVSVGEVEDGLRLYRELYRTARGRSEQVDILWRAGVAALRDGQNERAAVNLRGVLRLRPDAVTRQVATYWVGVAEERLGNRDEAIAAWSELARETPYDYYGFKARARLRDRASQGDPDAARALDEAGQATRAFPELSLEPSTTARPEFRALMVLARAGLIREAAAAARSLASAARRDDAAALLAARASVAAAEYRQALRLTVVRFGPYVRNRASNLPADFWELAYPRAFWAVVEPAAARHDVDPLLLLAIMRQESGFDPVVRSIAGAVGLFQFMPYTARDLAPLLGLAEPTERDLQQPSVSAALGALYVGRLLDEFDGALPPVVASYNAGEDRAAVWWKAARGETEEMFVDTVPYAETRGYLRAVLENYDMYRELYGSEAPRRAP